MGLRFVHQILKRRTSVRVVSAALIVATWRGPIPCVHFHGTQIEAAAPTLARHVRTYHDEHTAHDTQYWHFHLMLPQDVRHADDPANQDVPDDPLLSHQTLLQLTDSHVDFSQRLKWSGDVPASLGTFAPAALLPFATSGVPQSRDAVWSSGSFLTTLLRAAPLCAVTGVALC